MASNNFLILVLTTRGTEVRLSVSDKGDIGLDTDYQIEAAAIACGVWGDIHLSLSHNNSGSLDHISQNSFLNKME